MRGKRRNPNVMERPFWWILKVSTRRKRAGEQRRGDEEEEANLNLMWIRMGIGLRMGRMMIV